MTSISALQAAAQQISTDIQSAVSALNDLSQKQATGNTITQADIDAITDTLTGADTALNSAVSTDDPAPVTTPPDDGSTPPVDTTPPADGGTSTDGADPVVTGDPSTPDAGVTPDAPVDPSTPSA